MIERLAHLVSVLIAGLMGLGILVATYGMAAAVVVISILAFLSDTGGALDESCEVATIRGRAIAQVAPERFWTEQVQYLDRQISEIQAELERLGTKQESGMRIQAEFDASVRREHPEPSVHTLTPAQKEAADLRARADAIERAESKAFEGRFLEARRLGRLVQAQHCRAVAAARLEAH